MTEQNKLIQRKSTPFRSAPKSYIGNLEKYDCYVFLNAHSCTIK